MRPNIVVLGVLTRSIIAIFEASIPLAIHSSFWMANGGNIEKAVTGGICCIDNDFEEILQIFVGSTIQYPRFCRSSSRLFWPALIMNNLSWHHSAKVFSTNFMSEIPDFPIAVAADTRLPPFILLRNFHLGSSRNSSAGHVKSIVSKIEELFFNIITALISLLLLSLLAHFCRLP